MSRRTRVALAGVLALTLAVIAAVTLRRPFGTAVVEPMTNAVIAHKADADAASAFGGKRRLNILILGSQADEGTSDTIILGHLDLDRRSATLVSIPRDTWVGVPGHGSMKLTSVVGVGGAKMTARVVHGLTGAQIDATMVVNPEGAKQLVDAMGGININVERDMDYDDNYGDLHIHLKKGEQYLTGGHVLEYMRFRHDAESDFGRMRRQQIVVREIAREMAQPQNWAKIPRLIALARADVQTELSDAQLESLVEIYHTVAPDDVRALTLPSRVGQVGDASVVFVDERWAKRIGAMLFSRDAPPQDVVLVANATGFTDLDKVVVGALRGGGWNVDTFVDQPAAATTEIAGTTAAAQRLARVFGAAKRRGGTRTVLKLGTSVRPDAG